MIIERIKSFEYYERKLPLLLRNSHGYVEELSLLHDVLRQIDEAADAMLKSFDIFGKVFFKDDEGKAHPEAYLDFINNINGYYDNNHSDILDKIAELYGLSRSFSFKYIDQATQQLKTEAVTFNNRQLHILIRARVIQMNYDGSREQAEEYYKSVNLPIYLVKDSSNPATCTVCLNEPEIQSGDIVLLKKVFESGLLLIKSAGIKYTLAIQNFGGLLIFDSDNIACVWNTGRWA